MNKILLLLFSTTAFYSSGFSQTTERIYIKAGNDVWENFMKAIYLYPSFKEGMVEYKNGQRFLRPMNYNRIAGAVEFIDEKNDTLAIADEAAIGHINISGDVFVYSPVCLKFLSSRKVKLYSYEKMKIGDKQKIGAMGIPNTASAIESVEKIDTYQRSYNIDINETLILSTTTSYYIQTGTSQITAATKKNVLTLFSKNGVEVKEYIKSNNISFNKHGDLMKLVSFLDQL
ncbi:MAG TPA: hypothetical protein VM101_14790 [Flavitalea sp.]|nr:hypothetical protein [Flavitalea sp.]